MDANILDRAEEQANHCRAFGNARRLLIAWILTKGELSVNEIAAQAGSSLQNVSQHLSLLKRAGIVATRRDGQTIYYHIIDSDRLKQCPALQQAPDSLE